MLISIARMFLPGVDIHQFVGNKCVVAVAELRGKVGRLESTSRKLINGVTPVGAPTNYADLVSDRISALPLDVDGNGFSDGLTGGLMCHRLTAGHGQRGHKWCNRAGRKQGRLGCDSGVREPKMWH